MTFSHFSEPCQLPGLLATAIIKMDGISGQSGWRWIFILEGIATVVIALTSMLFLPADIQSATFFTDEEREFACEWGDFDRHGPVVLIVFGAVNRLRTSFGVTATGPREGENADPEKLSETKLEVHASEMVVDDERFEWGEVLRGAGIHSEAMCIVSDARN